MSFVFVFVWDHPSNSHISRSMGFQIVNHTLLILFFTEVKTTTTYWNMRSGQ